MNMPSRTDCHYIIEMLEAKLIDSRHTMPWAKRLLENSDVGPSWLIAVSHKRYTGDQIAAFREYVSSDCSGERPRDLEKFHVGCLWLRYERRELSWASFLNETGLHLDNSSCEWQCEVPFSYLTMYEDARFTIEAEERIKGLYLAEHDLLPWISLACEKYESLVTCRIGR